MCDSIESHIMSEVCVTALNQCHVELAQRREAPISDGAYAGGLDATVRDALRAELSAPLRYAVP